MTGRATRISWTAPRTAGANRPGRTAAPIVRTWAEAVAGATATRWGAARPIRTMLTASTGTVMHTHAVTTMRAIVLSSVTRRSPLLPGSIESTIGLIRP